jgi:hypothetical protein
MSFIHNNLKNNFLDDDFAKEYLDEVLGAIFEEPTFRLKTLQKIVDHSEVLVNHEMNVLETVIETPPWDVTINAHSTHRVFVTTDEVMIQKFLNKFEDGYTEIGETFFEYMEDEGKLYITLRGDEPIKLKIDCLVTLGEEYPSVIGEVLHKKCEDDVVSIFVGKCTVESCTWDDLKDLFGRHGIYLVHIKDMYV